MSNVFHYRDYVQHLRHETIFYTSTEHIIKFVPSMTPHLPKCSLHFNTITLCSFRKIHSINNNAV